MKKLDFFRKQGVIIKELAGINDDYFTRSEGILLTLFIASKDVHYIFYFL
ncbi:MAG: hypothetical protein AB1765_09200 [Candidatus Hydrogenedentota bacterium]